jgi:hypothetical protein
MSEEHLDLLSFSTRGDVGLGLGDRTGLVTSSFMSGARNLACRNVRAAPGLERAGFAVMLSGATADRAVPRDALTRRGERAAIFSQLPIPPGQIWRSRSVSNVKSPREKVPSVRSALSIRPTCGLIPRSSTSQPTISAKPEPHRRPGMRESCRTVQPCGRALFWPRPLPLREWQSSPRRP